MVSDRSHDFEETWSFLDRRMSDIGMLISAKATVSEVCGCYINVWNGNKITSCVIFS